MPRAKQCGADLSVHRRQLLIFFPVLKDTAREKASPLQYPCKTRNDQPKHAQEGSRSQINRWLSPILCFSSFLPRASFRFLSENVLPAEQEVRGASRRGGGRGVGDAGRSPHCSSSSHEDGFASRPRARAGRACLHCKSPNCCLAHASTLLISCRGRQKFVRPE